MSGKYCSNNYPDPKTHINSYDKDFIEDPTLYTKVYSFNEKDYELRKMPGDWYRFSAIIKPSKDKATISIKDNGDPDSFGLLVDNFVVKQKIKSCVCSDGQSIDEASICQ